MSSRRVAGDVLLAVVLAVGGVVGTSYAGAPAPGFALVVAAALLLAVRRFWPLPVLAGVTVCTSAYLMLGYPYGPVLISFMISVYGAARHVPPSHAVPWSAVALLLLVLHLFLRSTGLGLFGLIPTSTWVVVPFALGFSLRVRHEAAARARAETIRQSVAEERLRVAQEVHDIVGHGLAAIKMQADIALHVLAKKPEQAVTALEAISRTSGGALDELRATLASVRDRAPVPGLDLVDELRERMAEAGVYVRLEVTGTPPAALPVAVDLTGYRIVQESLTNVLRHGGAGRATVQLRYDPGRVVITVTNPVTGVPTGPGGYGIQGMRERALSLRGAFTAGPTVDGGFEVRACLPVGGRG